MILFNRSSTNYQWDIITEFILTLTNSQKEKPKSERKGKPEKTKNKAKKESDEESEEEQDESEEEDADISEGSDSDWTDNSKRDWIWKLRSTGFVKVEPAVQKCSVMRNSIQAMFSCLFSKLAGRPKRQN